MKISRALVLNTTCLFALSACVTSGGPSIEQNQSLITNAALISQNSDCTELVRNIEQMDAIILQSSNAQKNQYGSSSDSLKGTKQTISQRIYQNDAVRQNSGIASDIINAVSGNNSNSTDYKALATQSRDATNEKNRLVKMYQEKGCS